MDLFTIVGARPQFVKASAISKEIIDLNRTKEFFINENIIHTGQHYDHKMSDSFFHELQIPKPKFNLGIGGGSHGQNTGRMIESIEKLLLEHKPNAVLLYGDTDSTLAGAISASKLNIPILHIEAGLRSYNKSQPEEINRVITDYLSLKCYAPTDKAVQNLLKENIHKDKIYRCGDVMADAIRIFSKRIINNDKFLSNLNLDKKEYALATIHRAENTNNKNILIEIFKAFSKSPIPIVLPLHPRTRKLLEKYKLNDFLKGMIILDPLSFFDMMNLQINSQLIITDSGGIQKEAYLQSKPCITIRTETEWIETLRTGWNILANPSNYQSILDAIETQMNLKKDLSHPDLYGNGFAAREIINNIISLKL